MIEGERHSTRLVLLTRGVDDERRGAWFEPPHVKDLLQAAQASGLHLVEVSAAALFCLDPELAAGQLLSPGTPAPLPQMRLATFEALVALPPLLRAPRQVVNGTAALRRSAPSSLTIPRQVIRVGSVVLASVSADDGWWPAEIIAIKQDDRVRLRWRDFPRLAEFEASTRDITVAPPAKS